MEFSVGRKISFCATDCFVNLVESELVHKRRGHSGSLRPAGHERNAKELIRMYSHGTPGNGLEERAVNTSGASRRVCVCISRGTMCLPLLYEN